MRVSLHAPDDPTKAAAPAPAAAAQDTPTQQIVKAAAQTHTVTDETGRRITWRRLNALEDFDLMEIAGANTSNVDWMMMATVAFGVREIDGEPVSRILNKTHLRAMIARLDQHGIAAVLSLLMPPRDPEAVENEAPAPDGMERAKN